MNLARCGLYPCYDYFMANVRERASSQDRILIIESDPAVSDLIGRQALQSFSYQVQVAADANTGIARALQWSPDLILANLHLPGLSGKDLLVALASQGVQTPVIIMARRGMEADLVQTFRLGAADYLFLPPREAEVVNAVTRVMQQAHDRREHERLVQQLQQTNQEVQARVRELATILALGKLVTSITDLPTLFEKVMEGAVRSTRADLGWLLFRENPQQPFILVGSHQLPPSTGACLNQPWDDGISAKVASSGELLDLHGTQLRRFRIASLGGAALIVPIQVHKKVVGSLVIMRQQENPFGVSEQQLLSALADYASISLANIRSIRDIEIRARSLQNRVDSAQISDRVKYEMLRLVKKEVTGPLRKAQAALEALSGDPQARWRPEQRQQLENAREAILNSREIIGGLSPDTLPKVVPERLQVDLAEMAKASLRRLQPYAQRCGVQVVMELQPGAVIMSDGSLIAQVLDAALSNAIKFADAGGKVHLRVEKGADKQAHVIVRNSGSPLEAAQIEQILAGKELPGRTVSSQVARFGGIGIRLNLVKEILLRQNGKIWIENQAGKVNELHICLPLAR